MARDHARIQPPKPTENLTEWRARFDEASAHLDPIDKKYWLRNLIDAASQRTAIPKELRLAVYERDGHACRHCGRTEHLSLDHIHPYSLGGEDALDNLQTLCRSCNSRKGARV